MGIAQPVAATAVPYRRSPAEGYGSHGRGIRGPARRAFAGKASHHG
jgi:hypothetical protein